MLVLAAGAGGGRSTPAMRVGRALAILLVAVAAMTSPALAQGWTSPSVSYQFLPDGDCIAGPYANETSTLLRFSYTAESTTTDPSSNLLFGFWNNTAYFGAYATHANPGPGSLPVQTHQANLPNTFLIDGVLYAGLVASPWNSGPIWNTSTRPDGPADRVGPAYGVAGYVGVDMTTDPDCTPPEISGTVSPGTAALPGAPTLVNGGSYDLGSVPAGQAAYATIDIDNLGSGALDIQAVSSVPGTNIQSTAISFSDAVVSITVTPAAHGAYSRSYTIWSNDPSTPSLVFTLTGTAVDATAPRVTSIQRYDPSSSPTGANVVSWRVIYSEPVRNIDASDFTLSGTTALLGVSGFGAAYTVTASGGDLATLNGTVTLSHAAGQDIADAGDNALVNTTPTGANVNTFVISNTPPIFSALLSPSSIEVLERATLTHTVNNQYSADTASSLDVTGNLPAGVRIAFPANAATTCTGGALTAAAGTSSFTYSGGSVTGGATCTVSFDIESQSGGNFTYITGDLTSSLGNSGSASMPFTVTAVPPTITIAPLTGPTSGTYSATITLSKPSTDFTVDDLTLTNATATLSGSGTDYTAILTPLADGPVALSVDAARFTDASGIANDASNEVTASFDGTKPTVTISGLQAFVASDFTATLTFSENVTGFTASDVTIGNGSVTGFSASSARVYRVDIAPGLEGPLTIDVAADVAQDGAGNGNIAASQVSITVDRTGPVVTISSIPTHVNAPFEVTFSFNEPLATFNSSGVYVVNGTRSPVFYNGTTARMTVTPTDQGAVNVGMNIGTVRDAAGNDNESASASTVFDSIAPTVTLSTPPALVAGPFTVTVTFSEPEAGLVGPDLLIGNGTVTSFASSGVVTYTAEITPTADGPVTIDLPAGRTRDFADNPNAAAAQVTTTFDGTAPTVVLSALSGPVAGVYTTTATFSEAVTGLDAADLTLVNASATIAGSGSVYTITLTPDGDGVLSVQIPADVAMDAASNGNAASNLVTTTFDGTAPTVVLSALTGPVAGVYTTTATFSEAVTGLDAADLTLVNASATIAGSGSVYTITLTPDGDGALSVQIPADVAMDAASNLNAASNLVAETFDGTAPTVTLSALTGPVAGVYTTTATFSEDVTGLDAADLTLINASATIAGSGSVYTITLTPGGDGAISVQIPSDVAMDAASNLNAASNLVAETFDGTAPTVVLSALTGPVAGVYTTTATFSEDVTGLDAADLTLVNASATIAGSGSVYTITLTPDGDGALSVQIPADVAMDDASNLNAASNLVAETFDGTAPTVTLSALSGPVAGVYTTTATFSEDVTGLDAADLTLVNASATIAGSGSVYTITLTPDADGALSVQIPADVAMDAASNGNAASNLVTTTFDGTAPTVVLSALTGPVAGVYTTTATFSEAVTGLDAADLTLVNASATIAGSGSVYTITLTPDGDGALSVQIPADVAMDAASNGNAASNLVAETFDGTAPTVVLSALTGPVSGVYTTTATFSEDVSGLDAADLTLVNASATIAGSGSVYTITLTPDGDGALSVQIPADVAMDAASNGNAASNLVAETFDGTAPTVTLSALTGPVAGVYTTTATFSEDVTGLDAADLTLVNASATIAGSGSVYTITLTPDADGALSVQIPADVAMDAVSNGNAASNLVAETFDGTAPTVTLSEFTGPTDGSYTAVITLSEPSTDFTLAAVQLVNASATLSGAGQTYTLIVTPLADGLVSAQVTAGSFTDAAGNANEEASSLISVVHDGAAPSVVLNGAPEAFSGAASFSVTVVFSEPVSGFGAGGIVIQNARVTGVSGSGDLYTASIRADGGGDVTLQVAAGAAQDLAGNPNLASEVLRIENRTVAETQGQIARFMLHRADQLVSNQPGLICLMQGSCGGGSLDVSSRDDGLTFSLSTMSSALTADLPLWLQLRGSRSNDPMGDTEYLIGSAGAHYRLNDRLYLGMMLQFDHVARNDGAGRIEGSGWLAGPYVVGRLADHPLYFEGRLLWGQTRNTISPFGTYTDRFDTNRMLAMVRVTGEITWQDVTLMPTVAASHTTDRQHAYTDSLGNVIGAQDIALSRVELGLDARWPILLGQSAWTMESGITALHTRSSGSGLALANSAAVDGTRARIDLGLRHVTRSGGEFSMSGYYDGIGQSNYEGYGMEIEYRRSF
ncbi:Ig-like domain-containing protein [Pararhodobacter sp. CCB-MM2]|uniref:Ig-like domain-containing protein n=1 Tax=Pararhodobacter sp. CCB-MM2 TaxID=1786003 RepID=UPI001111C05A|nr:Ig-like domain-containing protein [Pararhodobacter sp. CCB-MM2]